MAAGGDDDVFRGVSLAGDLYRMWIDQHRLAPSITVAPAPASILR